MKSKNSKSASAKKVGKGSIFRPLKTVKYLEGVVRGKQKLRSTLEAGYSESTARNAKYIIEQTQKFQKLKALLRYYLYQEDRASLESVAIGLFQEKDRLVPSSQKISARGKIVLRLSKQELRKWIIESFFQIQTLKLQTHSPKYEPCRAKTI